MLNDVKEFETIRVFFSKTGRAKYISHLDLNRTMIRAFRRAGLPIWYTEGFNRHPYVTFAAPLSLGYEGDRETMDIRLKEEMNMEELVQRLDGVMPEGLHVFAAGKPVMKPGEVKSARYAITASCAAMDFRGMLSQTEILVDKRTKKNGTKPVDLKPILSDSEAIVSEEGVGNTHIELVLPCNSTLSINPSLVMAALCRFTGREEIPYTVRRRDVYGANGESFR